MLEGLIEWSACVAMPGAGTEADVDASLLPNMSFVLDAIK